MWPCSRCAAAKTNSPGFTHGLGLALGCVVLAVGFLAHGKFRGVRAFGGLGRGAGFLREGLHVVVDQSAGLFLHAVDDEHAVERSTSCCTQRASRSSQVSTCGTPRSSWYLTVMASGRTTVAANLGKGEAAFLVDVVIRSGHDADLRVHEHHRHEEIQGRLGAVERPVEFGLAARRSTTHSMRARPTCCAARPMPSAACMVAIISCASLRKRRVKKDHFWRLSMADRVRCSEQ